ncbi:hypothetical protein [Pseudochryseolinea flava]|uniref:DUF3379 domain-containing protein n=1 Tax=Pseudochryseolinea flava TaxID=2059302 RepID=A0A364XYI7_9BACT|nr:hypothetical protein [Pseudochryseolinea flava]RAV99521.1 hypothetical protein DQQ10_18120 [Pseudochryseolinea flava]
MKKLEDIPKKQVFEVPEGYFDSLPTRIQSRITGRKSSHAFSLASFSWKYALPVVLLTAAGIFWFSQSGSSTNAENILASVETEDLVAYLEETDLSTDEILTEIDFNADDANEIEQAVYDTHFDGASEDELLEELDLNTL